MSLTTPDRIRTLQRKLYAKAKQEPAYRFYALYDKIYRKDILSHAWRLVRANGGSPGIDGISFEAIEKGIGIETFLGELARDLKEKTYRAAPVRRVMIPKADGSLRRSLNRFLKPTSVRTRTDSGQRNRLMVLWTTLPMRCGPVTPKS